MKKFFISSMLCLSAVSIINAEGFIIDGKQCKVDTLEYYPVGPGTMYTKIYVPTLRQKVYTLTVDLQNQYNDVESFVGQDKVIETEKVSDACARNTGPGRDAYAGINSDFFYTTGPLRGYVCGGSVIDGVVAKEPDGWWYALTHMSEDKKPHIDYLNFKGYVRTEGGEEFSFSQVNVPLSSSEMTMYNRYAGGATRPYEQGDYTTLNGLERTEIYVTPLEDHAWGVNRKVKCRVDEIVQNYGGGAPIEPHQTILSGVNSAKVFLDKFKVGDELEIEQVIYTQADERPKVKHLAGGNAVLMVDGVLTDRNTNDNYNTMIYPRSATGHSADGRWMYLLVADGKGSGGSPGLNTIAVCDIMKHMGASDVCGLDGGGSSEMIVNHEVASVPADGSERSVGNGWMLVANAPVDSTISEIVAYKPRVVLPRYGVIKPAFLGYNQYGFLLDKDVQDVVLSCAPEVGEVLTGGRFMALDGGVLTATYRGITIEINVVPAGDSPMKIYLDSVLVDQRKGYAVEVHALVDDKPILIPSDVLTWTVDNPEICSVEEGILKGIENGKTFIEGQLGDFKDTLEVQVELPETPAQVWSDFKGDDVQWKLIKSSAFSDMELKDGAIEFTYKSTRGPYFKLESEVPLYGLPDSVQLHFNTGGAQFSKIIMGIRTNTEKQAVAFQFDDVTTDGDVCLSVATCELQPDSNVFNFGIFPLWLEYLTFNLATGMQKNQVYTIPMRSITLCYEGVDVTYLPSLTVNTIQLYPNPTANDDVCLGNYSSDATSVSIYDMQGRLMMKRAITGTSTHLNISTLSSGTYFVQVGADVVKMVKK